MRKLSAVSRGKGGSAWNLIPWSKTYSLAEPESDSALAIPRWCPVWKLLKSNMDYGMFLPVQAAAIAAITGTSPVYRLQGRPMRRAEILCATGLHPLDGRWNGQEATMFVWPLFRNIIPAQEAFVMELVERAGVMVTPGSAFGPSGEGYVRLALVQDEEMLNKAIKLSEKAAPDRRRETVDAR